MTFEHSARLLQIGTYLFTRYPLFALKQDCIVLSNMASDSLNSSNGDISSSFLLLRFGPKLLIGGVKSRLLKTLTENVGQLGSKLGIQSLFSQDCEKSDSKIISKIIVWRHTLTKELWYFPLPPLGIALRKVSLTEGMVSYCWSPTAMQVCHFVLYYLFEVFEGYDLKHCSVNHGIFVISPKKCTYLC